jgi:glycerol kinase
VGGAAVQWLRDGAKMIDSAEDRITAARTRQWRCLFVPALTGLGAPHWDQYARGNSGHNKRTTNAHIACYHRGNYLSSI